MRACTLSGVNPNWPMMKPGALFRITARCNENAASSAVTGAPEAKRRPAARVNVQVRPSSLLVQRSASCGSIRVGSAAAGVTSFS